MGKAVEKYGLGIFVVLLLLPGFLVTAHIFADHQHVYCDHYAESHIHKASVDCDIFHFQQNTFLGNVSMDFQVFIPEENHPTPASQFPDLRKRIQEFTPTRGPPTV